MHVTIKLAQRHVLYWAREAVIRFWRKNCEGTYTLHRNTCAVMSIEIHVKMVATRVKNCFTQAIAVRVPVMYLLHMLCMRRRH